MQVVGVEVTTTFDHINTKDFAALSSELLNIPRAWSVDCAGYSGLLRFKYSSIEEAARLYAIDLNCADIILKKYRS